MPAPVIESEAEFQRQVIQAAELYGWEVMHVRRSVNGEKAARWTTATSISGWPDLVLFRDRILFRELKSDRGRLSDDQRAVLRALAAAGGDVDVWRPKQWPEIQAVLRGR